MNIFVGKQTMTYSKLTFLFLLASVSLLSQNHRFSYEYTFRIDSLNRDHIDKEIMNLDVTKNGSTFYSGERYLYDSLSIAAYKRLEATQSHTVDLSKIKNNSKIDYFITKTYSDLNSVLHNSINGDRFAVEGSEKLTWKILPENKEVAGFKAQKATTTFGGRIWTAWFTNDIQFQDGPYKFCGLPGLILNIQDNNGDHVFRFVESKKVDQVPDIEHQDEKKEVVITGKKFGQLWKEYERDPAKKIRQIFANSDITNIKVTDANGKELNQSEIIRMKEQRVKDHLKQTNNYLELSLYQ